MSNLNLRNDKYCSEFLEKKLLNVKSLKSSDKVEFQKKKFKLVNNLVKNLFKRKNSPNCYNNISNLIILTLTSTEEEEYPFDIFSSEDEDPFNHEDNMQSILKEEFDNGIENYVLGRFFHETVQRFCQQYECANNFIISPKERDYSTKFPN